ncbi:hypothetical protein RDI58_021815 [Solanum bulbocastanum]|uniref:Uncharacterized protein n=1 Tax=Solanum bulbocastanum TaxID=147425 RepID=A0AAN8T9G0_SOLBU
MNLNSADGCLKYHELQNTNYVNASMNQLLWCVVCHIATDKPVTMRFFQDAMAQAWMP